MRDQDRAFAGHGRLKRTGAGHLRPIPRASEREPGRRPPHQASLSPRAAPALAAARGHEQGATYSTAAKARHWDCCTPHKGPEAQDSSTISSLCPQPSAASPSRPFKKKSMKEKTRKRKKRENKKGCRMFNGKT